ncbi:leucine-rich repeat protein [Lachnospiraceae bacterium HCP1S3_B10]
MKKIIKQLIAFIMVVTMVVSEMPVMNAKADKSEEKYYDGFYYDINEDGESVSIIGCDLSGDIVIPEEIDGMKVTRIGDFAFKGNSLTSISLPDNLVSIGDWAFWVCRSLTSVKLPDSLTSIGEYAFMDCRGLLNIYIPANVTEIGDYSFLGCTAVESIKVNPENSKYDSRENCNAIIEKNPTGYEWEYYKSVLMFGCKNTKIPSDLTGIKEKAFLGCTDLIDIKFNKGLEKIGDSAFSGCTGLKEIELPSSMNEIGNSAFSGCVNLEYVKILSNYMMNIGGNNFNDNDNVTILCKRGSTARQYAYDNSIKYSLLETLEFQKTNNFKYYINEDGNSVTIADYIGDDIHVEIPEKIEDKAVTAIADYAFSEYKSITDIKLPLGIKSIGESAFRECIKLANIEIPETVTNIGKYAFCDCGEMQNITLSSELTDIGEYAFANCNGLTEVEIPINVTNIGKYAFQDCKNLENIKLPPKLKKIEEGVFRECTKLKNVEVPPMLASIEDFAFDGCTNLRDIELPDSLTNIGRDAFIMYRYINIYCSRYSYSHEYAIDNGLAYSILETKDSKEYGNLKYDVNEDGKSVTIVDYIGSDKELIIPDKIDEMEVTAIGDGAFYRNKKIQTVKIPAGVKYIGEYSFYKCGLDRIELPAGLTTIGYNALDSSVTIYCRRYSAASRYAKENNIQCKYYGIDEEEEELKAYEDYVYSVNENDNTVTIKGYTGVDRNLVIPETIDGMRVTCIGREAFIRNYSITDVQLPDSITEIDEAAFNSCNGLTVISLPESLKRIEAGAFDGCYSLKNVILPSGVTYIGTYAFHKCGLKNIVIPAGVTDIGIGAFSGCKLESVQVDKENQIYDSREECNAIIEKNTNTLISGCKSTTIPQSVIRIGEYAFEQCSELYNMDIPSCVISIGTGAFSECDNLSSVKLPEKLKVIEKDTFERCLSLTEINIPSEVTEIGDNAFYQCITLPYIIIPSSVRTIGRYAFAYCIEMTGIKIYSGLESIKNYAFSCCYKLENIRFPSSIKNIEGMIFSYGSGVTIYCIKDSYVQKYIEEYNAQEDDKECQLKYVLISESTEEPTEGKTEESTEKPTEGKTEESTEKPTEGKTEESTEKPTEDKTEESTEKPTEDKTEESTEKPTEDKTEESTEKPTEDKIEESTEKPTEDKTEESTEKPTEDMTEEPTDEPTEQPTNPVRKKTQVLKVTKSYIKEYGAKSFALNVKHTKGDGKIKYTVSDKKVITVSKSGKVSIKGNGVCTVVVQAAETDTYKKAVAKITITVKPKKNRISEVKAKKNVLSIVWTKDSKSDGYELQCSTSKSFSKKATRTILVQKNKTTSYKVKKIVKGKKYYVRARAYKNTSVNGKKKRLYGRYSQIKQIKI